MKLSTMEALKSKTKRANDMKEDFKNLKTLSFNSNF